MSKTLTVILGLMTAQRAAVADDEHALELARAWPHANPAILPAGHGDYLGEIVASASRAESRCSWSQALKSL